MSRYVSAQQNVSVCFLQVGEKKGERTSNVTSSYLYTSFIFYLYAKHGFIKSAQPCFDWDLTKMWLLPLNPFINTHIIGKKNWGKTKTINRNESLFYAQ